MNRVRRQLGLWDDMLPDQYKGCIAIVDSGIARHIDIQNQIIGFRDFTGKNSAFLDEFGHGTHVAGICAGTGRASGGLYRGIVPGAALLNVKVLDAQGKGTSDVLLRAMHWLFDNRKKYDIKVINISIHVGVTEDLQQFYKLCKSFFRENVLVVVSAGNNGPKESTLSVLGDCPYVLTVGCHDDAYFVSGKLSCKEITSRGPGKHAPYKPDIVAPGTQIMSLSNRGNGYVRKTGTSMATPIVSGFCYALFSKYEHITCEQMIRRLFLTAKDLNDSDTVQGHGMIQAACLSDWGLAKEKVSH